MCMYMYSRLHVHFALLCLPTLFTIFHAIIWNHVAKSKRCMEAANFNLRNVAQFPSKIAGKGGYQSPFWLENQNIQNKEKAPRTWAPLPLTFCIKITGLKLDHAFNSVLKTGKIVSIGNILKIDITIKKLAKIDVIMYKWIQRNRHTNVLVLQWILYTNFYKRGSLP